MKKRRKQKNIRFKAVPSYQASQPRIVTMQPEDFVIYIRRAEKEVLPIIKEIKAGPAAAQFLLAQHTHVLATGSNRLSTENAMHTANTVLSLWQGGFYVPSPEYPFTLEETLQEIQGGLKATEDHAEYFQVFNPTIREQPRGSGQVFSGIVRHPETNLWQIWVILDGPCVYLGAYRDSTEAQRRLEEIVQFARRGGTEAECKALYEKTLSRGDGLPKQIPFNMMEYLIENIHLYTIKL